MNISESNTSRTCEVCGRSAAWESGTPNNDHLPNRRQRFLCGEHYGAWAAFDKNLNGANGRFSFLKWQLEFDRFLGEMKG